jgi:catechol 2,3-dioxygenase-like lactoylglutathione lyase family enzyme
MAETQAELSHGQAVEGDGLGSQQPGGDESAGPARLDEPTEPAVSESQPAVSESQSAVSETEPAESGTPADSGQPGADYEPTDFPSGPERAPTGAIHHVELWVPNLDRAIASWGWLLTSLGYRMFQDWPGGRSWQSGHAYIVVEQSPDRVASRHDRCRPGLNHLAFHVASRDLVDELTAEALLHGWTLMFRDLHPYAGGPQHYAAYLENSDGYEAELVAD